MSLPSIPKEKTSNKVSLVTRPSVTLVQPVSVIGSSVPKTKLIYVQSIQTIPPSTKAEHVSITTKVNTPKSSSQPVTIAPKKPISRPTTNQLIAVPSTSSASNRLQTFLQFKASKVTSAVPSTQKSSTIVGQTVINSRLQPNDKHTISKIGPIQENTSSIVNNKSLHLSKIDPVKLRYRTILENLLQLKNSFIRRTITQAIQQKLANQSNEDLLNVIFKSFELTLLSVNIEQIYLNETYLNATTAFLAKVIETGRYMELIENRRETQDIKSFITSEMSSILNKVSLESVYKNAREIFEEKQRGSYAQILELLIKVVSCIKVLPETKMTSTEIEFWLKDVFPLAFDSDEDIQTNAIKAVKTAMPMLLVSHHHSNPLWEQTRSSILNEYTVKIGNFFKHGSPKWYMTWCICVRLLDIDIPRSARTLNAFLSIVEPALRSNVPIRRAEGYLCWRVLLEVLVRHNRLNSEKRLKLMCTPLKSLQAKTVEIATNKFQAWWYVICNVQGNVDNFISMVFEPFLHFCFGPLLSTPKLLLEPNEASTQVKSFPDVSLMAIVTFIRVLGGSDKQIDELFTKFSLNQPSFVILNETIFSIQSTATYLINACGEATLMLNRLKNNANNNIDCITLAVCLWSRMFKYINQAKKIEHINLILDNVSQLLRLNLLNPSQTKMIPVTCSSILVGQIGASFLFDRNDGDILSEEKVKTIVKLMNTMVQLPNMKSRLDESLAKLLSVSHQDDKEFEKNFTFFLTEFYEQFIQNEDEQSNGFHAKKLTITYEFIDCILQYIQCNAEKANEMYAKNVHTLQVFYKILYWPLSLYLHRNEFDDYTKTLLRATDLLTTIIGKLDFCKESAKAVKNTISHPDHCIYVNDTIATLFEYMVYEFDDLKNAPLDMLNLCVYVIKNEQHEGKKVVKGLKSITEALIKFRRAISQSQFEIIAPKLCEIVRLIDGDKMIVRAEPSLVKDLVEMIGKENKVEKSPALANKMLRSSKNNPAEFVVVNKVWKLEPSKLTEHQKEKMKTRRCDIPALYNDLSQSQDSASIQGWAPKALEKTTKTADEESIKSECNENNAVVNDNTELPVDTVPSSQTKQKTDKASKTSPKRSSQSQSDSDRETTDETHVKRRMNRELNRIQIDAKVEEVPYNSLSESNRLTRSTIKKIEEKPDTHARRKTRSDSVKPTTEIKETRVTRTSLVHSPVSVKAKNKVLTTKPPEIEASSEPTTPKRRSTRNSILDTNQRTADTQSNLIQKDEKKKTEFKDTLELKVEKLPTEEPTEFADKPKVENTKEVKDAEQVTKDSTSNEIAEEQMIEKPTEDTQHQINENNGTEMEIDEPITAMETDEKQENTLDTLATQSNELKDDKMEVEVEQNAQILVETETISTLSNGNCSNMDDLPSKHGETEHDSETDVVSRSYMSALVFDDTNLSKSLNGSSIVTSPEIAAPRSLEFLSDTINISPIASATANVEKTASVDDGLDEIKNPQESVIPENQEVNEKSTTEEDRKEETELKKVEENDIIKNVVAQRLATSTIGESPIASGTKQIKTQTQLAIQSSTPIQSHHSPVSSKFKTPLSGRGAQLLNMIKSPKPASPTPMLMAESAFVNISKTASPAINQLETAPIYEHVVSTPDTKASKEKQNERNELKPNENGNFLTLSGALPSPYESPGISILKRKSSNISMDDSIQSPAHKRKRVSFGFPLSHTKEYIIDEEFTPFYMLPSNDSPCRRANRLKKLKLKRNKNQNDSAKTVVATNDSKTSQLADSNAITLESTSHVKQEDVSVSVKQIREIIGMDRDTYRAKQEKKLTGDALITVKTNSNNHDSNSDDSSTESNEDEPIETVKVPIEASSQSPQFPKTLDDFSDDAIFSHLLSKYSPNDILKKFDSAFDARVLTKRLSTMMTNDKQIETVVLEELAEQHSESFLENAITENLCSVICDRLTLKSPNAIIDYTTEKINMDENFASNFLDKVSVSTLRQKLMDIVATSKREQHILLDDFLTALKEYIGSTHRMSPRTIDTGILPEHIHLWISKLFDQFKITPEQYLQLTSIFIQRNPPASLENFD
ncbi:telomere-associated protein RIF1 [Contarinia nasturtii]|uniref:telomere-associated protein RIF1 n=1 Tax=Contarinia nasturtii TaxID=265458 RepID=UPI0012D37C5A|nr:telomere-associated protein RIF1 [Contarinia nasturtii]XP_031630687.1 telomere-associated protein RIF1 [Contarinia nasturtii]XP_031630688.1 telomere-associated protein RIF1 [Contarinia nasturtii]XP_031630689.1 telomere-associated protein RIF1 [Contarinia nasturtii]XP_031630690.1 telomere-associated protein RIF1 [Contarinia nasturtii]XP_031630691.1 telomere-associated protein RIF1 [Contarinia nasturtii]